MAQVLLSFFHGTLPIPQEWYYIYLRDSLAICLLNYREDHGNRDSVEPSLLTPHLSSKFCDEPCQEILLPMKFNATSPAVRETWGMLSFWLNCSDDMIQRAHNSQCTH